MKQCTKCRKFFPETTEFFHKNHTQGSGLHPRCRLCRAEERRLYHEKNREKERLQMREYARTHSKEAVERMTKWKKQNPEKLREHDKQYRQAHKQQGRVNVTNRQARLAKAEGAHTANDIEAMLINQGGLCFYCYKMLVKYDVDHVVPISRGGDNSPSNLVVACPTCNRSKGSKLLGEWLPNF